MASQPSQDPSDADEEKRWKAAIARLSPHLRSIFERDVPIQQLSGVTNPARRFEVLEKFGKISDKGYDEKIGTAASEAILNSSNAVDVFFSHAPTPQQYQSRWLPSCMPRVERMNERARGILKCLDVVDDTSMEHRDTLLLNLRRLLDRSHDATQASYGRYMAHGMFEDVVQAVSTGANPQDHRYNERARAFIEYVFWIVRGRKDAHCHIKRPWLEIEPAKLREEALPGLGSLFALPGLDWTEAFSCGDAKDIHRLTVVFQIVFTQYLLHKQSGVIYYVSEHDGIVKVMPHGLPAGSNNVDLSTCYFGFAPNLNLSQRKVEAALHAFACREIKGGARSLLEYFFRSRCAKIEFINFVPKNAHITVERHDDGDVMSNMVPLHTVVRLTLGNGMRFTLDSTAPQYGWNENITPYDLYARHRIDFEYKVTECMPSSRTSTPSKSRHKPFSQDEWKSTCLAEHAVGLVQDCFKVNGGLDGILCLEKGQFEERCRTLKATLESGMNAWVNVWQEEEASYKK